MIINISSSIHGSYHLSSNANDPASRSRTRVPRGLALLVSALAQVIGPRMHDDGTAQDALGTDQFDQLVGDGALGVTLGVGLEVTKVADVADGVGGGTVFFGEGIDCW